MEQLYGQVKIPIVESLDGATANISTITGFNKQIVLTYPETSLTLPGMEEYVITHGRVNDVIKFTLDCGQFIRTTQFVDYPDNLNDASWSLIQELIQNGKFSKYYNVGDYKNVTLTDGQVMKMIVAEINDGSTLATYYPENTVDFISENVLDGTYNYGATNKNPAECPIITTVLNSDTYNKLSSELKSVIKGKYHRYFRHTGTGANYTLNLWLPTLYEIGLTTSGYDSSSYNKSYSTFTDANSRIKRNINGTAMPWWSASSYNSSSYTNWYYYINTSGDAQYSHGTLSSYKYAVPLCFRVG